MVKQLLSLGCGCKKNFFLLWDFINKGVYSLSVLHHLDLKLQFLPNANERNIRKIIIKCFFFSLQYRGADTISCLKFSSDKVVNWEHLQKHFNMILFPSMEICIKMNNPVLFHNTFLEVLFIQISLLKHSDFGGCCCVLWNITSTNFYVFAQEILFELTDYLRFCC